MLPLQFLPFAAGKGHRLHLHRWLPVLVCLAINHNVSSIAVDVNHPIQPVICGVGDECVEGSLALQNMEPEVAKVKSITMHRPPQSCLGKRKDLPNLIE